MYEVPRYLEEGGSLHVEAWTSTSSGMPCGRSRHSDLRWLARLRGSRRGRRGAAPMEQVAVIVTITAMTMIGESREARFGMEDVNA